MKLAQLTEALDAARLAYLEAQSDAQAASVRATASLNRLNEAQRAFDAEVDAVRKNYAPRSSDWGRNSGRSGAFGAFHKAGAEEACEVPE